MRGTKAAGAGRKRLLLGLLAVVVVVFGGAAALTALRLRGVADDLRAAERLLQQAGDAVEDGRIGEGRSLLDRAARIVTRANGDLYGPLEYSLLDWLPPVDANLTSLRASVGAVLTLVDGGIGVLDAAGPLVGSDGRLEVPLSEGAIPLDAVAAVSAELSRVASTVWFEPSDDRSMLVGDVAELERRVADEVVRRRQQFGVLGRALDVAADLAGGSGPRRYLLAVANTAEMRGAGGMVLNYGVLLGAGGDFELGEFGRIDELRLAQPVPRERTGLPDDYLQRWAGFDPLLRWRNATMSADFELVAPVLAAMYEQATGEPVDGVIQVDPHGLAAILRGTGPVQVPELGAVDAANVVDVVLNQAYVRFPDIDSRSDVMTEVAEATFDRLVEGDYPSLRPLAEALVEAAEGRHVLAWSRSGRIQAHHEFFGVDGALPDPSAPAFALTAQNLSGNKLDYYVDTALRLTGDPAADGTVTATVALANTLPAGQTEPEYVVGPNAPGQVAGQYRAAVSLYVPFGTQLVQAGGGPVLEAPVVQAEDGRTVIGFTADVRAGGTVTVDLVLRLPPDLRSLDALTVHATPRVRPTTVSVELGGLAGAGPLVRDLVLPADAER